MLSESNFTAKLLKALRACGDFEQVWKLSDRLTSGLPDFIVWRNGQATCFEVKLLGARSALFKPLQLETLRRVDGYYIIHAPASRVSWLFKAAEYVMWSESTPLSFEELVKEIRAVS